VRLYKSLTHGPCTQCKDPQPDRGPHSHISDTVTPAARGRKGRTSWHVSRILFPGRLAARRAAVIHLGLPLPAGSSGLPADSDGPSSNACAGAEAPSWPCSGWGLPSRPGHPGRWWSLTPPFHPYPGSKTGAVCFLWHFPAGHPGLPLATTLPCGVRTFLGPGRPGPRPPCQLVRGMDATRRRRRCVRGRRRGGGGGRSRARVPGARPVRGADGPVPPSSAGRRRGCRDR
jgi:hypothetical protein